MSAQDVREFLYANMKSQRRFETDDAPSPLRNLEAQKDDRVLTLLNQLGERLIRSERERLELKETVGRYADLIGALENKIDKQALAEESLRERQDKIERDYAAQMQKMQKAIVLAERIEEAINQQNRLARRIEQITQDKARMLRKLERIEEAVVETQTALNAKSLVLVGEQSRAVNDPSATMPPPANQNAAWQGLPMRRFASRVAAIALVAGLSWGIYQSFPEMMSRNSLGDVEAVNPENLLAAPPFAPADTPDVKALSFGTAPAEADDEQSRAVPAEAAPAAEDAMDTGEGESVTPDEIRTPSPVTMADSSILAKSDDELVAMLNDDPDALATALNNIAPGAAAIPPSLAPAPVPAQPSPVEKNSADQMAINDFLRGQADSRPLAQRIQSDASLPAAFKDVEAKAFQGVPEAQHDLAAIYTAGQGGVKTDFTQAAKWFEEAALNGIANARYNLGVLYHQGLGVAQDTNKAINWYKAAASQNHPEAQYNLGIAYIEGVGTEYNPQKAAANFESAARAGILEASYNLGLIYENGLLGTPQIEDAVYWYSRAAEDGSPEGKAALNQLGRNMGYSESRIQEIYKKRKATLEGVAAKPADSAVKAAVATATETLAAIPVSTAATAIEERKPVANEIPVLPLDAASVPLNDTGASAGRSTRNASVVAQIQEHLMNTGLYPGPADGTYNDVMADAIRSYQKAHNLASDGRASEALLIHMLSQEGESE
ncbi:MAG: SEL1-like repeat protein [Micavibrio aeruginosavorus]|uniref:SEL1-like repeat protein n=1 Tax=Micavibrio aeruginosavorus TaxID=349221 RepID=A0A7T5R3T6_9BACT|nr:MAG: SEL1-like repeat protein [Micavibrio aeruginosavorus]